MPPNIWTPTSVLLADDSLFSATEIEAYEREILANPRANEHDASRFFAQHPKFLYLGVGAEVRREVVLAQSRQRADFFRRSFGEKFWNIIELKGPNAAFISGIQTHHPHLSSETQKAISQALDYRDLVAGDPAIRAYLQSKGILVCRPQIVVVVGQHRGEIDAETLRILFDREWQRGADARSYTDLYAFAKERYQRSKLILLPQYPLVITSKPVAYDIDAKLRLLAHQPEALCDVRRHDFEAVVVRLFEANGFDVQIDRHHADNDVNLIVDKNTVGEGRRTSTVHCRQDPLDHPVRAADLRRQHILELKATPERHLVFLTTGKLSLGARTHIMRFKPMLHVMDFDRLKRWLREPSAPWNRL